MYGTVRAELINGSGYYPSRPRPWVARLTGLDPHWGFNREFVKGVYDYTYARRSGSRGIYIYWALAPGMYEVFRPVSWKHEERLFCQVLVSGEIEHISKEQVIEWLKNTISESTS